KTPNLGEAGRFGLEAIVDRAGVVDRDLRAAEIFLADLLAERALDHRWTGGEDVAGAVDHDRPVREDGPPGRPARRGAERGRNHRHLAEQLDRALEAVHAREDRMATLVDRGH